MAYIRRAMGTLIEQLHATLGLAATRVPSMARAVKPRGGLHLQLHLRCDPALGPLADDPRFRPLLITPRPNVPRGC